MYVCVCVRVHVYVCVSVCVYVCLCACACVLMDVCKFHIPPSSPLAGVINTYEPWHVKKLRSWAVSECLDHIRADDQFTDCISIGPVSPSILTEEQ